MVWLPGDVHGDYGAENLSLNWKRSAALAETRVFACRSASGQDKAGSWSRWDEGAMYCAPTDGALNSEVFIDVLAHDEKDADNLNRQT
ncbi:MAG: hypothetical protein U0694_02625 [Anaerolineae bacterium]